MHIIVIAMKKLKLNEGGFIPMLILLVVILVAVIVLAYLRVSHANH